MDVLSPWSIFLLMCLVVCRRNHRRHSFEASRPNSALRIGRLLGRSRCSSLILDPTIQDAVNLSAYVHDFSLNQFLELATNFHFLLFVLTNDIVKFSDTDVSRPGCEFCQVAELCAAVREQDRAKAMDWAQKNVSWTQLSTHAAMICEEHQNSRPSSAGPSSMHGTWDCKHCTFRCSLSPHYTPSGMRIQITTALCVVFRSVSNEENGIVSVKMDDFGHWNVNGDKKFY